MKFELYACLLKLDDHLIIEREVHHEKKSDSSWGNCRSGDRNVWLCPLGDICYKYVKKKKKKPEVTNIADLSFVSSVTMKLSWGLTAME